MSSLLNRLESFQEFKKLRGQVIIPIENQFTNLYEITQNTIEYKHRKHNTMIIFNTLLVSPNKY